MVASHGLGPWWSGNYLELDRGHRLETCEKIGYFIHENAKRETGLESCQGGDAGRCSCAADWQNHSRTRYPPDSTPIGPIILRHAAPSRPARICAATARFAR